MPLIYKKPTTRWRTLRIALLSLVLVFVAANTWYVNVRTTDWKRTLWAVVYPINGDGSAVTAAYLAALRPDDFAPIADYVAHQVASYRPGVREPLTVRLAREVTSIPPEAPQDGGVWSAVSWSLRMRWYAWHADNFVGPSPDIQLFVVYHDPALQTLLRHSVGLQKGHLGLVNAFADGEMSGSNNVVITHELLHTLGATDKYALLTSQPRYPDGYAEPDRLPPLPQRRAEIMAGRIPITETRADIPRGLRDTVIGPTTAREIRLID